MQLRLVAQVLTALTLVFGFSLATHAEEARIGALTIVDQQYMGQQRDAVNELVERNFGGRFNGATEHDLALLQRLLDRQLVRPDQTQELQALGIILGDLLAADLDMHWVVYEDKVGRSRALRYKESEEYLFPVTMISRRREADNRETVSDIYQKAYDIIDGRKPPRPFQ